jgi:hypothetical protein
MKFHRKSATAATLFASAVVLGLFIHQTASSDAKAEQAGKCSAQTLKGSYGIKFEGIKFADQNFAADRRFVSVSLITFDGRSTFTTSETGRSEGVLVSRTFTGPYLVNADCTGFLDFSSNLSNPPHIALGDFVIVDEGKGFFVLDNEEGWAAGGVARKL